MLIFIRNKMLPPLHFFICIACIVIGLVIFSELYSLGLNIDDIFMLISMLVNSVSLLMIDAYVKGKDSILLGMIQMLSATLFAFFFAIQDSKEMIWNHEVIIILLLTGVIGSGVAFTIRNIT